ncbi:MAG: polysaccharide biosynthesis/export family protein [Hyphomicrobiales bacterium]
MQFVVKRWVSIRNALAGVCLAMFPISLAEALEYQLGGGDKLQIRIIEWKVVENTFLEWPAVSGEYVVDASGNLTLPFAGTLSTISKTSNEISQLIAEKLQKKFGMARPPEASVQILEHRPFFVTGDVDEPGSFPYVPGLTVLKAIAFAGGHLTQHDRRTDREAMDARGNILVLDNQRIFLLAKRARLMAERDGKAQLTLTPTLDKASARTPIIDDENKILRARKRKIELQLQALTDLRALLGQEIESMEQKAELQERQVKLAREEFEKIGSLAKKGLVVSTRMLSTERTVADLEGRLLDLESAILRAKQDVSETTQDEINIKNSFENDIAIELQNVEEELKEVALKMQTQLDLMSETLSVAGPQRGKIGSEPGYSLVRQKNGKLEELQVNENTALLPGDVLKVKAPNWFDTELLSLGN